MIIAHAPAGYLSAKWIQSRGLAAKGLIAAGIAGALAPDLDMFYFYLVDGRQHHHHTYWTHYPIVWGSLLAAAILWFCLARQSKAAALSLVFCINGFLHLVLDSLVGDIWWFAPFIDKPFAFFTVSPGFKPWWLNFILHWSFLVELLIVTASVLVFKRSRKKARQKITNVGTSGI